MRLLLSLIFFLSLITGPAGALAAEVPPRLVQMFIDQAAEVNVWPAADIRVEDLVLMAPDDLTADTELIPVPGRFLPGPGRRFLELRMRRQGRDIGRVRVGGEVHLMAPVVLLARTLPRHHLLTRDDIRIGRGDVSVFGPDTITAASDACGKRLRVGQSAGTVLKARDLKADPLVRRGEQVRIVANVNGIMVRVPGRAREDGHRGEMVRVKNMMSRRLLMARVIDRSTVAAVY